MRCTLRARRIKKTQSRLIIAVRRTDATSGRQAVKPCSNPECLICNTFHEWLIQDIEQKVPSLVSPSKSETQSETESEVSTPERVKETCSSQSDRKRRIGVTKVPISPYSMYKRSCLAHGYDPEELARERERREERRVLRRALKNERARSGSHNRR